MSRYLKCIKEGFTLAEGPLWLKESNTLVFVDILGKTLNILDTDEHLKTIQLPDMPGCVVPMDNDNLLVAVKDTLLEVSLVNESITPYVQIPQEDWLRFNDGKCDEDGRLWIGSMAVDQDHPKAQGGGIFYCIESGKVTWSEKGYTIPNGLDFLSKTSFYHTDSSSESIDLCSIINQKMVRKSVINIPKDKGVPDGFCMDTNGNLWVALWGGSSVVCISPDTGKWLDEIILPDANVTCCCFGGPDMKHLYITTAQDDNGNGGKLYKIELPVEGRNPFSYRNTL